jgi:hypothetical protein
MITLQVVSQRPTYHLSHLRLISFGVVDEHHCLSRFPREKTFIALEATVFSQLAMFQD